MSNSDFTTEQFRSLAPRILSFLQEKGFQRASSLEESRSTYATVVYLGKHVGFVFSFDVRDQCVDAEVIKVRDQKMKSSLEGGYSSDIFGHLVRHAGYRGSPAGSAKSIADQSNQSDLQRMIAGWAQLLKTNGQSLLADKPESLPNI